MNITELEPKIVWKYFQEITQVPRPSKKEARMIAYLEAFAGEHQIEFKKDEAGNVLMKKQACAGYENYPTIILQSHMDMVCEKNADKAFDFDNDPIETVIDGEWVKANGTTLGADNGIGVAAQLALLASDDIPHGNLEFLFTVDEETGMTGADSIKAGFMEGKILLNLDSEDEGEFFIGCAGGKNTKATLPYNPQPADANLDYFRINVKGLKGGHSGGEIHAGLGNANKILARFLYLVLNKTDMTLVSFDGGNLHNAIPREASALIGIPAESKENIRVMLNKFIVKIENELRHADKDVVIEMQTADKPETCMDKNVAARLVHAINACPHGVIAMSHDIEGLVETSTNLAAVKTEKDKIVIVTSQRSSIESSRDAIANQIASVFILIGANVVQSGGYPGWSPNPESPILKVAVLSYKKLFGKEPQIKAIHAGLECGLFLEKYPWLDMISFGPTLRNVHSPDERICIPTVELWWKHLLELLDESDKI